MLDLTLFNKVLVMKPWSIGRPEQFFDLKFTLKVNGKAVDKAGSYTALVDYRTKNDGIEVNYLPCYYFRMVLDQGYFPRGGMTAERDEELLNDVSAYKASGLQRRKASPKNRRRAVLLFLRYGRLVLLAGNARGIRFHVGCGG